MLYHVTAEQVRQNEESLNSRDTQDEYMIEELAVLGGPSDLHHAWRNDRHLVVPNTRIHAECTTHTLKGWGVASCLRRGKKNEEKREMWIENVYKANDYKVMKPECQVELLQITFMNCGACD